LAAPSQDWRATSEVNRGDGSANASLVAGYGYTGFLIAFLATA